MQIAATTPGGSVVLETLLNQANIDINLPDETQRTLLMLAASRGCETQCLILLEKGADPNMADPSGRTVVSLAASNGLTDVVKQLLKRHITSDMTDRTGRTPLSWSAAGGHFDTAKLLVENGVNVDYQDDENDCLYYGLRYEAVDQGRGEWPRPWYEINIKQRIYFTFSTFTIRTACWAGRETNESSCTRNELSSVFARGNWPFFPN